MQVRDGMSTVVSTVGPGHTLREAARLMAERKRRRRRRAGSRTRRAPGIITERDVLRVAGRGRGSGRRARGRPPDVDASCSRRRTGRSRRPPWRWCSGGFRHLVVIDGGEIAGVLSVRDVVRCWTDDGAICEVRPPASAGPASGRG